MDPMTVKALDAARTERAVYAALADERAVRLADAQARHAREVERRDYFEQTIDDAEAARDFRIADALVTEHAEFIEKARTAHSRAVEERDLWDGVVRDFERQLAE